MPEERKDVSFDDIRLKVGDALQMQPLDTVDRTHYRVRYIGAVHDASLLTTLPRIDQEGLWMRPNGKYVFRLLAGDYVYAFIAKVVMARAHPYPYAHFTIPESVQARRVRSAPRIELRLDSEAELADGTHVPITLLDLSLHGALVETRATLGETGATLAVTLPIYLSELNRKLALAATVRNRTEGERPRYGLEFGTLAADEAMLLHFFIDHLVAEGPGGA